MASIRNTKTGEHIPLPAIIKADGTVEHIDLEKEWLHQVQEAVGGYVEMIPVHPWADITMLADEEGRIKGKPYNHAASMIAGQGIVGDVVIMERTEEEDDEEE